MNFNQLLGAFAAPARTQALPRDSQRSLVYRWEAKASNGSLYRPDLQSLEDVEAFLFPIWRSERGRVGLARQRPPTISRHLWGQRRATAGADHVIKIPRALRSRWVCLHEMAHRLTPRDEAHGPRFVGVLIGLLARHLGYDAEELMSLADEMGVRYYVRSIGCVPVKPLSQKIVEIVEKGGPLPEMFLAAELDVSYLKVRGAALFLIRQKRARWFRNRLTLLENGRPVLSKAA